MITDAVARATASRWAHEAKYPNLLQYAKGEPVTMQTLLDAETALWDSQRWQQGSELAYEQRACRAMIDRLKHDLFGPHDQA